MAAMTENAEVIYDFIWNYVTAHEALPTLRDIADQLHVGRDYLWVCIDHLRESGLLDKTTLKPTAYDAWWRENARHDQTWQRPENKVMKPITWINAKAE